MKKVSLMIVCILLVLSACGNKETNQEIGNGGTNQKPIHETEDKEESQQEENATKKDDNNNSDEVIESENSTSEEEAESVEKEESTEREIVKVEIKDDSSKDPELKTFMEKLKEIVALKDREGLLKMTSDNIHFSFGADGGKEGFIKKWGLDKAPEQSHIWKELNDALSFGGTLSDGNLFTAPSIFMSFPEGYDHFQYGAILGENVNVREKPSTNSKSIMKLSYEVVEMPGEFLEETLEIDGEQYRWVKIRTLDGTSGYVAEKYVRNPVDYRVGVEQQKDGSWEIVFFIAGD
jgi:hypothetical protein